MHKGEGLAAVYVVMSLHSYCIAFLNMRHNRGRVILITTSGRHTYKVIMLVIKFGVSTSCMLMNGNSKMKRQTSSIVCDRRGVSQCVSLCKVSLHMWTLLSTTHVRFV